MSEFSLLTSFTVKHNLRFQWKADHELLRPRTLGLQPVVTCYYTHQPRQGQDERAVLMIIIHRGVGGFAPGFGLLFALLMNVLTYRIFGASYYEDHRWPKFSVLVLSGLACLVVGILIKRKRQRDAYWEQQAINSLSQKHKIGNVFAFSGPRDHLMYIPLQYWSIVYFVGAIIYLWLGSFASAPAVIVNDGNSRLSPTAVRDAVRVRHEEDERMARQVKDVVLAYCQDDGGRPDASDALSAMAAVVGERCLDAAGEIPVRTHDLVAGQRVFSDKVDVLLTGVQLDDLASIPSDSVFGTIRDQLAGSRFQNHFPPFSSVYAGFAARIGKPEDWGKVPLSIPEQYWPKRLPLRVAFDTRKSIDATLQTISADRVRSLHVCTLAMVMMLKDENLANQVDTPFDLTLMFETINGMSKTVPMASKAIDNPTRAMREAQHQVLRIEPH